MRLVFVTQVLDRGDAVLGFVSRWVEAFAHECERVRVVALEVGDTSGLPANVDTVALGRTGRVRRFLRYRRALTGAFREGFDGLLTHMVPRYSTLAAPYARRAGVPHHLWYTHKGVDRRLLAAIEVVDGVFTASEESLRVDTPKRIVTGHGIDAAHFEADRAPDPDGRIRLLSVGRVTPAKDPLTVVEAVARLREDGRDVSLTWAGGALAPGDEEYGALVERAVEGRGLESAVRFVGAVPYPEVPTLYRDADVFVNASRTGSVDKVVLEAMAARLPFVTCNESIPPLLDEVLPPDDVREHVAFGVGDSASLAERVACVLDESAPAREARAAALHEYVRTRHNVDDLVARLVDHMARARNAS
ncbi:MAG: glycosyltransferase family 4 protein [Planctomycetota bacterium]